MGVVIAVYGLVSADFTLAELGERAPIQFSDDATIGGLLFAAFVIACQFVVGGAFGVFARRLFKGFCTPKIWERLNQKQRNWVLHSYSHRLAWWLLDLPPVSEWGRT